jgi:hypothetical protein
MLKLFHGLIIPTTKLSTTKIFSKINTSSNTIFNKQLAIGKFNSFPPKFTKPSTSNNIILLSRNLSSIPIDGNQPVSVLHFGIDGLFETRILTKERILRESRLAARDYVVLAQGFSRLPKPALLVRSDAIIVSLYQVRAVIHHDRVLVFNPQLEEIKRFAPLFSSYLKLSPMSFGNFDEPPDFELRALEGILDLCTERFAKRALLLNPLVDGVLKNLSACSILDSFDAIQDHLLPLKEILSQFEIEATLIRNVLAEVLKSNEDMLNMLLTEKHKRLGETPPMESHYQVELLLEAYLSKFIDIAQLAYYLRKRVESNQSVFELRLGSHRNRMMNYNLQLSMMSIGLAWSTTFFGMFGMNLLSGIETVTIVPFWTIVVMSTGSAFIVYQWLVSGLLQDPISTSRMNASLKSRENGGMNSIFNHLDDIQNVVLNGVSKEEFQNALSSLRISQEAAAILWDALDRDKDGKLSLDEVDVGLINPMEMHGTTSSLHNNSSTTTGTTNNPGSTTKSTSTKSS